LERYIWKITQKKKEKENFDVQIFWKPHVHIHSGIVLEMPDYNSPHIYVSIILMVKYS